MKKTETKSASVAVLPTAKDATNKLEQKHSKAIRGCCQVIIDKVVETGRLYLDLCLYIRKNMVSPKLVSTEMSAMGFNRQVISRVNKVANASDELFSQFQARTIGFNKVLELSRGSDVVAGSLAAEMGSDVTDVKAQIAEMEKDETSSSSGPVLPASPEDAAAKHLKSFEMAAARVLSAAAALQWKKQKKVVGGNGYVLLVVRDKKWKPVSGTPENVSKTEAASIG